MADRLSDEAAALLHAIAPAIEKASPGAVLAVAMTLAARAFLQIAPWDEEDFGQASKAFGEGITDTARTFHDLKESHNVN